MALAEKHGYVHRAPEDTYLDETVGFTVALFGFYTQWQARAYVVGIISSSHHLIIPSSHHHPQWRVRPQWGFALPFPFNVVMFPFSAIEWYIRWSITAPQ